tara:strand:- start:275 stop:1333 length:1059 start_codon:yes stop_codon:yes gene_type:complete
MFKFKIFNELNNECEKYWKKLEENSFTDFFQTFDYHQELISNYDIKELNIVVILDKNGDPLALFPFFIKEYLFLKVLQFIGTKYSDYCNPLVDSEFSKNLNEKIFKDLWKDILKNLKKIDFIFLNNQLESDKNPLIYYLKSTKFSKIFRINLKENFNTYKNDILKINKNYHYEIHRTLLKKEKLKKNYDLQFEVKNLDEADLNLDKLIETKINIFSKKKLKINLDKNFFKIFVNLNNKNKNFFISTLKINNEITAACFSINFKDVFYYFIPVVLSKKFEKYKIGKILILDLIDWSLRKKIKTFDFGLGAEKYKRHFSNSTLDLFRYYYYKSLKGFILYLIIKLISLIGIRQF